MAKKAGSRTQSTTRSKSSKAPAKSARGAFARAAETEIPHDGEGTGDDADPRPGDIVSAAVEGLLSAEDLGGESLVPAPPDEGLEGDGGGTLTPEIVEDASSKALTPVDPVATYLAEIRRYPVLSREEEMKIAIQFRETGDPKAAEQLVTANLRFVVKIAAEYSKFGAKLIDLIQEGNVGLMHAVKEFNPYRGVRLITYAVWWIRGYIQEYLMRQYSLVRIGTTQNQRKLFYRLQKEKELLDSMGHEATIPLLSSRLGVSEQEVEDMSRRLSGRDISLNQPVDDDSRTSLLDFESASDTPVDDQISHLEEIDLLKKGIEKIRGKLSEKETYILENRILADDPMTLQEIGDHFQITREAVRQLEARLIGRIRSAFEETAGGEPPESRE